MDGLLETGRDSGGDEIARQVLETMRRERLRVYTQRSGPLYFGRIDRDERGTAYVGRHAILDGSEMLVMNWRAPAAAPFYSATTVDREGISLRRRFDIAENRLLGFVDEHFDGEDPDALTTAIIEDILRRRSGTMGQIVATITPTQNALIRADAVPALVVQGGPGTGKTAVGLHRAAWLLYDRADFRRLGVLIVGPNPAFMRYIGQVLPALGEDAVEQRELHAVVAATTEATEATDESLELKRLKGSARLARVLERLLWNRVDTDADTTLAPLPRGPKVRIGRGDLAEAMARARERHKGYRHARAAFRDQLGRTVASRLMVQAPTVLLMPVEDLARHVLRDPEFKHLLNAVWPTVTVKALVSGLFRAGPRLDEAAAGVLSSEELALLTGARAPRESRGATPVDAVLIDEAQWLIEADQRTYAHVVVDEAQNLTEMELRMIARRARSISITLLGDIDQRTTDATHSSWTGLADAAGIEISVQSLPTSYRVPTDFLAAAAEILEDSHSAPAGIRLSTVPPLAIDTADVLTAAIELGKVWADAVGATALIVPPALIDAAREQLRAITYVDAASDDPSDALNLFDIESMKGLEVDAVIVVEPCEILDSPSRGGTGALYTALTRSTQRLAMIHSARLPAKLSGSDHVRHLTLAEAVELR